uniref:Type II toxin-antitoxin system RelE/ParE family toxin n=1 Tax=Corynebacterium glutamicum TaxID=1718 RepID=D2KYA0_CORGT|nr:hypothetical protein [Corynebacterium glutamicum]
MKLGRSWPLPRLCNSTDTIQALGQDPYPAGCVDLGGREGFRVRVRDYRILHSVLESHLVVEVVRVGPRGDVYK